MENIAHPFSMERLDISVCDQGADSSADGISGTVIDLNQGVFRVKFLIRDSSPPIFCSDLCRSPHIFVSHKAPHLSCLNKISREKEAKMEKYVKYSF